MLARRRPKDRAPGVVLQRESSGGHGVEYRGPTGGRALLYFYGLAHAL
jgi:hypothetical protein